MSTKASAATVLLSLIIFASRAVSAVDAPHQSIWKRQVELKLETSPLLLADETDATVVESAPSDWHFHTYASVWATAINGTDGRAPIQVDVDAGLGEVFDNDTLGLEFNFEAGTGRWSFILDGMWMHLGDNAKTTTGFNAGFDGDFGFLDIATGYELRKFTLRGKTVALDGLFGLRWTKVYSKIKVNAGPLRGRSDDTDKDFVDPYLGLRARWYISDPLSLTASATIGGAGVGSDVLATGQALLEYHLDETWSVIGGYRAYYYDYSDKFDWNVTMHGPLIGIAARW